MLKSTKKLLKPFGVSQVVPTKDFTEILVSMELDDHTESSKLQTSKVSLSSCNHLLEKNPCSTSYGTIRQYNTTVVRNGKIHFTINNAAKDPKVKKGGGLTPDSRFENMTETYSTDLYA